ncbi:LOW QUALITY PROTEIN: hypothetical protein HID58_056428 [Brassica napus]|uniref:Uncharacterized protein n=1 Tax=Brassica napus TaxID=3708 RepID=A0ABQ8AN57_BRANA|nr:LOW QUALITY PROTEIN: hypothetical protein HID58_056428 [Brassica napus]
MKGPAYGRRVNVRAIAGGRLFPSSSFIFLFLRRPSTIIFVWRKDAVGLGAGVSNLVRCSVVLIPGHGSYPSSVIAGPSPGGGGFLRSTDSGFSYREEETYAAPSLPALGSEGGGFQSYALSVMRPVVLWVVATSLWRNSMKLSAEWLSVEEKFGFGGGFRSDETRCMVVVFRRCSDAVVVKSRHR